jgi:hypothetical protein
MQLPGTRPIDRFCMQETKINRAARCVRAWRGDPPSTDLGIRVGQFGVDDDAKFITSGCSQSPRKRALADPRVG